MIHRQIKTFETLRGNSRDDLDARQLGTRMHYRVPLGCGLRFNCTCNLIEHGLRPVPGVATPSGVSLAARWDRRTQLGLPTHSCARIVVPVCRHMASSDPCFPLCIRSVHDNDAAVAGGCKTGKMTNDRAFEVGYRIKTITAINLLTSRFWLMIGWPEC